MPSRKTRYTRLETDPETDSDDEAPPAQVQLHSSQYVKASRWNHIENLDEFFDRVYQYKIQHGLVTIILSDVFELAQFAFVSIFSAFILTCLNFHNLFADKLYTYNNSGSKDVELHDLFDFDQIYFIHPLLILILLFAFVFWFHRLCKTFWRAFKFWEIRNFYIEALKINSRDLRDCSWKDILNCLKEAQKEYKMNIRKQELTELDVYHRMLRFKNYLIAMVNKGVLPCKIWVPFYGEKVFFTMGLKYNYEMLLFWGPGAPFKNGYHLHEEYKTAAKKYELIKKLKFRISVLALINLLFSPFILLYQILYSFFSYAELLKRQPGVFGRRHWSLYGKIFLQHFNEVDHELIERLNRAYEPAVKYMDLFVQPVATLIARNIAFLASALLAVLLTLTVIQEDLLTAHNVLTTLTVLGIIITVCRIFIPDENQARNPRELMTEILTEIHYMPDHWKEKPHTVKVNSEFSQVFQFTMMYLFDELVSPIVTPFILYFSLRGKANDIIDFFRNFTIEVSGVGDVCSFAEMNPKKHGHPDWQTPQMTRAGQYEQGELGKTELSLIQFSHNNPNWEPGDDANMFISQMRESVEELHQNIHSSLTQSRSVTSKDETKDQEEECTLPLTLSQPSSLEHIPYQTTPEFTSSQTTPFSSVLIGSMSASLWVSTSPTVDPIHVHQVHDINQRLKPTSQEEPHTSHHPSSPTSSTLVLYDPYPPSDSSLSSNEVPLDTRSSTQGIGGATLNKPLLPKEGQRNDDSTHHDDMV